MYKRTFRKADQTHRFLISSTDGSGWDVREEQDRQVILCVRDNDWHRVERARMAFASQALSLQSSGWSESERDLSGALLHEPVAQPNHSLNLSSSTPELSSKATHVHVHRPGFDETVVSPHPFEQPVA